LYKTGDTIAEEMPRGSEATRRFTGIELSRDRIRQEPGAALTLFALGNLVFVRRRLLA